MTAWPRLGVWIAVATAVAVIAPDPGPLDESLHPPGEALALGVLAGAALFAALARRKIPAGALAAVPRRRTLARAVVLTARSAHEEAIWRGLALGLLIAPAGRAAALVLSTALFAATHVRSQGRAASVHLLTGAVFGLTYLATGRLVAAIAAHGTYNVLVGAAALARAGLSVSDTGAPRDGAVRSGSPTSHVRSPIHVEHPISTRTPSGSPRAAARLDGVVKSFGSVRALDGVDLELRPGEVLALLGANGAGKSTAVAVLLGLRRPDAGRASLAGRDPRDPVARRSVGAVLQDVGFPPTLRVRELVELVRAHYPAPHTAPEALARLGLSAVADRQAAGLSGGERRRLAVALALAGRPTALFLDEPTAAMDPTARRTLLDDLAGFAAEGGAVLLTTQQLVEAEEIASRVVVLAHGRVAVEGTVAEVRARAGRTRVTLRAEHLPPLPGVASVESRRDRHVLYVTDAAAVVGHLARAGVCFRDLEVAPASLEDAFLALTGEDGEEA